MVVPLERLINMNTQKFKNINSFNLNVSNTQFVRKTSVRRVDYHFFSLVVLFSLDFCFTTYNSQYVYVKIRRCM